MRVNRGLLGWGVFFVVAGCVPLAVRNGVVDQALVQEAWGLWPLILVGIGLGLVLTGTRAAVAGTLVVAITCGLLGGAVLTNSTGVLTAGGLTSGPCGGDSTRGQPFPDQQGAFDGSAQVRLEMRCGDVQGTVVAGTGWTLSGRSAPDLAPVVRSGPSNLTVTAPERNGITWSVAPAGWTIGLPDGVDLDLAASVDAGSARLALDASRVTSLNATVNAGDARVRLARDGSLANVRASVNAGSLSLDLPATSWQGRISVNAGSAEVCLPAGAGLQVRTGDISLGSTNLADRGLVHDGDTWSTPGYASAASRAQLSLDVNLGSFTLNPEDGCG